VVSYKSEANKQYHIARQTTDEARAEYQACDRIQVLKRTLRAKGTIVWLSGSLFHVGDTGEDDHWHSYVMIYYEREVVILDPEYVGVVKFKYYQYLREYEQRLQHQERNSACGIGHYKALCESTKSLLETYGIVMKKTLP